MRLLASRTIVLAMMLTLSTSSTTFCQKFVAWGVKGGLTNASQTRMIGGTETGYQSRVGLSAGLFAEWIDHPWLSVNSEVCYNQKGHKLDIPITTSQFPDGTGEFTRESVRLDYLSIALLPKLRLSVGPVELYALVGPRVDIAIGHSVVVDGPEPIRTYYLAGWNSNLGHYRDIQVGGDFAIGCIGHALPSIGLGAEVRYSPDFSPSSQFPNASTTNQAWEFSLSVRL